MIEMKYRRDCKALHPRVFHFIKGIQLEMLRHIYRDDIIKYKNTISFGFAV